jgi:hypothetical protein
LIVFTTFLTFYFNSKPSLVFKNISFNSKPVTLGVPNTVVFNYDASQSNADSIFIQQSWDPTLRHKVVKTNRQFTTTYYYPGYFRAKLILNDSIIKEHDIFIESDGWLGTITDKKIPHYLTRTQIENNGVIGISENQVLEKGIDLKKEIPLVSLYRVRKTKTVPSDNFVFETQIRNTYKKGEGICQNTKISLLCTNGGHTIPLAIKGCVGELDLILGNEPHNGATTDLSNFGVDFSDWVKVRCEVKNKRAKIWVVNRLAFEGNFRKNIGKIVGLRVSFVGTGEVRNLSLESK